MPSFTKRESIIFYSFLDFIMYTPEERFASYKRATVFFTIYSIALFFFTIASFLSLKTIFYFLLGFMLSGAVAALLMIVQYKVEKKLDPNFWILNIVMEVVAYFLYTYAIFYLFFLL